MVTLQLDLPTWFAAVTVCTTGSKLVRCVGAPEMQPLVWFSSMPGGSGGSVGMVRMLLLLYHLCRMCFHRVSWSQSFVGPCYTNPPVNAGSGR